MYQLTYQYIIVKNHTLDGPLVLFTMINTLLHVLFHNMLTCELRIVLLFQIHFEGIYKLHNICLKLPQCAYSESHNVLPVLYNSIDVSHILPQLLLAAQI